VATPNGPVGASSLAHLDGAHDAHELHVNEENKVLHATSSTHDLQLL